MKEQMNCIFCQIIAGSIAAKTILETETSIVIQDIAPKAPIHYLIIPKKHITDIQSIPSDDMLIAQDIFTIAQKLSAQLNNTAFRLVSNNGSTAGQVVFHLHVHFLAGMHTNDHFF